MERGACEERPASNGRTARDPRTMSPALARWSSEARKTVVLGRRDRPGPRLRVVSVTWNAVPAIAVRGGLARAITARRADAAAIAAAPWVSAGVRSAMAARPHRTAERERRIGGGGERNARG